MPECSLSARHRPKLFDCSRPRCAITAGPGSGKEAEAQKSRVSSLDHAAGRQSSDSWPGRVAGTRALHCSGRLFGGSILRDEAGERSKLYLPPANWGTSDRLLSLHLPCTAAPFQLQVLRNWSGDQSVPTLSSCCSPPLRSNVHVPALCKLIQGLCRVPAAQRPGCEDLYKQYTSGPGRDLRNVGLFVLKEFFKVRVAFTSLRLSRYSLRGG